MKKTLITLSILDFKHKDVKDELLLEWNGYQIFVLDAGGLILKLKVIK